jgi:hypothetical protein
MARETEAQIVGAVLDKAGIPYAIDKGRKHVKVRWEIGGKAFFYSCAATPSDRRAGLNCRCAVRRILRAAGIEV